MKQTLCRLPVITGPVTAGLVLLVFSLLAFAPPPQNNEVHGRPKTQPRPALSGPALSHATDHFVIHYTLEGDDAIAPADEDGNGLPDYLEAVAKALEFCRQQEVERLGWSPPLADRGEGGDRRFDVYLQNQYDLFGYVETANGYIGDNPHTPFVEASTAYGYLALDNDYAYVDFDDTLASLDIMRTTVAHELHHAIQSAYDDNDPYEWLYEASAVWMEDEIYPAIGDAKNYLLDYMDAPDLCPLSVGRDDHDVRWYGGWIFLRYISEHHGGPATIERLWKHMATQDGLQALQTTLTEQNTTLDEVLVNFSIANLTKAACPDHAPYCYVQGNDYLRPYVEGTVRVDPGELDTLLPKDGVQQFGADYVRIKSKIPILIDFQGSTAGQWEVRAVGLGRDQVSVTPLAAHGPTRLDPSEFDRLYLVIVNTTPVAEEADCGYQNYTLTLADAAVHDSINAPAPEPDPDPYIPPFYEGVFENTLSPGQGQPVAPGEASFDLLYPGYLPAAYTLDQTVTYTTDDLGDMIKDYAPGGEPIMALEYVTSNPKTYLSITQSQSPYTNVTTWVSEQGYSDYYVRLVDNKPVYLIDYSEGTNDFSSAILVHHNLFVVMEGTIDFIEMQHVVAGFLANNP